MLKGKVSSGRVTAIRRHVYEVYVELLSELTGSIRPLLNRPCSTSRSVRSSGKYRVFSKAEWLWFAIVKRPVLDQRAKAGAPFLRGRLGL